MSAGGGGSGGVIYLSAPEIYVRGTIPAVGTAYLTCSKAAVADGQHAPTTTAGW